jgi:hypothetical protein
LYYLEKTKSFFYIYHVKVKFNFKQNLGFVEDFKETNARTDLYSKRVKAGKRTYFFDVKSTRGNDFYLTITESKKRFTDEGFHYEKHKIFLYKEDFSKFVESLEEAIVEIKALMPEYDFNQVEGSEMQEFQANEPTNDEVSSEANSDSDLKWD